MDRFGYIWFNHNITFLSHNSMAAFLISSKKAHLRFRHRKAIDKLLTKSRDAMPKLLISRASSNWIKYQQENKNTIAMAPMPRDTSWVHWAIVTYSERNRSAYLQFMFQVPWIEFPSPKKTTKEHVPWAVVLHETPHLNNHCWCHSMSQFHSHHGLFMPFR